MDKIIYNYLSNEDHRKAVELFEKICNEPGGDLIYPFSEKDLVQMLRASNSFGAWDMDRLAGLGVLILDEEATKSHKDLLKLNLDISIAEIGCFVDYDYRGKGIAKILTDELINHARKIGIDVITATARKENVLSEKILINQNFVLVAEYDRGDGHLRNVYKKDLEILMVT